MPVLRASSSRDERNYIERRKAKGPAVWCSKIDAHTRFAGGMDSLALNQKSTSSAERGQPASSHLQDWLYLGAVLLLFSLCFFAAGPWGNFPINDDMIYGTAVKSMVETGSMRILVTNAFNFIPLQLGSLVCSVFGYSYDNLRLLTFAFGLFAAIPIYLSLREIGSKPQESALLTGTCMMSPFILNLTCTFMSDIPALAFTNWSLFHCLRAIKSGGTRSWILALLFLTAAIVTRQNAICFLPVLLVFFAANTTSIRRKIPLLSFGVLLPVSAYLATHSWLKSCLIRTVCLENYTNGVVQSLLGLLVPTALISTFAMFSAVLGLLALPLTVTFVLLLFESWLSFRSPRSSMNLLGVSVSPGQIALSAIFAFASTVIPLLVLLLAQHHSFPFYQNLFSPPYVGTYQIIGAEQIWRFNHLMTLSYFSTGAACLLVFTLTLFSSCVAARFRSDKLANKTNSAASQNSADSLTRTPALAKSDSQIESQSSQALSSFVERRHGLFLAIIFALGMLATLVQLSTIGLDRYVTTVWAPLCLIVGWMTARSGFSKFGKLISALLLAASGVYAVLCLNDCMNLNRAQWQALSYLEQKGVNPLLIDGGQEYNFQHGGNACITGIDPKTKKWPEYKRGGPLRAKLRWWPINGEDYIISCLPIDGYTKIAEFNYWNTLKWRSRQVFVLQADAPLDRY